MGDAYQYVVMWVDNLSHAKNARMVIIALTLGIPL